MEDGWDLHAVVRSCSTTTTTSSATIVVSSSVTTSSETLRNIEQDCNFSDSWFKDPFELRKSSSLAEDLYELWKPFFPKQQFLPISPLSASQDLSSNHQQQQQEIKQLPQQKQQLFSIVNGSKPSHHPSPRPKKRKNHSKKVCHVAVDNLSSDMWSWRKYGQKPIKGSPYPSTSKGCMARKQVERNRSDPRMFIVTYTGDHNHPMPTNRSSLAGSTRQKPASDDSKKLSSLLPPERLESGLEDFEEDDEDEDFFAGLEDFTVDCQSESEHFQFPCLANNAAVAAAAAAAATTTTTVGGG